MALDFDYAYPPSYSIYQRMLNGDSATGQKGMPKGVFYLKKGLVVPYSYHPTSFLLSTDDLDNPITIQVSRIGAVNVAADPQKRSNTTMLAPAIQGDRASLPADYKYKTTVGLQLGQRENEILVTQGAITKRMIVTATHFATILMGYAEDLYNYSVVNYDRQKQAIFSPTATRLAEPLFTFGDMLPDVQTLQMLASKMMIREFISEASTQVGVNDFLAGLVQSTPYFIRQRNGFGIDPPVRTIFRTQEHFSGSEAHVWIPNVAVTTWAAFIRFIQNLSTVYGLESVSEKEVIISVDGELHGHVFDFDAENASLFFLESQYSCYDNMKAVITIRSVVPIRICAPGYSLDLIVQASNPLFDFGYDPADFVGLALTGRLDGGFAIDTTGQPSPTWTGAHCVYENGYYTQTPQLSDAEVDAPALVTVTGNANFY